MTCDTMSLSNIVLSRQQSRLAHEWVLLRSNKGHYRKQVGIALLLLPLWALAAILSVVWADWTYIAGAIVIWFLASHVYPVDLWLVRLLTRIYASPGHKLTKTPVQLSFDSEKLRCSYNGYQFESEWGNVTHCEPWKGILALEFSGLPGRFLFFPLSRIPPEAQEALLRYAKHGSGG